MNQLQHLSEDQICRWLGGERDAEMREHLSACERCRRKVGESSEAFDAFQAMARQESADRMARYAWPREKAEPAVPGWTAGGWATWGWTAGAGLVAAAAIAVALMLGGHGLQRGPVQLAAKTTAPFSGTAGQSDDDAAVLKRVNADLSRTAPGPMEPLQNLITEGQ